MSNTLLTKVGDSRTLPLVLLTDYLKYPLDLEIASDFEDDETTFYDKLPQLKVAENTYVETPATMLRHVLRNSNGQTLYNEDKPTVALVDNVIMHVYQNFAVTLNKYNKLSYKNKQDKKKSNTLKTNLKNEFQTINKLISSLPEGTTAADFVVFGVLGSVQSTDLKKALNNNKNIKKRWEALKKDETFVKVMQGCYNRFFK